MTAARVSTKPIKGRLTALLGCSSLCPSEMVQASLQWTSLYCCSPIQHRLTLLFLKILFYMLTVLSQNMTICMPVSLAWSWTKWDVHVTQALRASPLGNSFSQVREEQPHKGLPGGPDSVLALQISTKKEWSNSSSPRSPHGLEAKLGSSLRMGKPC